MWDNLSNGEEVVITKGGKPSALIIGISEGCFEEVIQVIQQARAMVALDSMRKKASQLGILTDGDIEVMTDDARGNS